MSPVKSHKSNVDEHHDQLSALVRAYVPISTPNRIDSRASTTTSRRLKTTPPSDITLVFDTETTTDGGQALRLGSYQLRKSDRLIEEGLFYDPKELTDEEMMLLREIASDRSAMVLTKSEFIDDVFYGKAYELRATILGFNLPFDIARLAVRHSSARGRMKGGFTFQLSNNVRLARVQVRHLNSRAAFIQFALPPRQRTARGARKRGIQKPPRRGSFVDLKTIAAALLSRSFSLKGLAAHLKTKAQKHETEDHGSALTKAYVEYALQDVQVTWECFAALSLRFNEHGLTKTHLGKILSEASLGKAYLREMGIASFRDLQPDFPNDLLGWIVSTYFGGRSETHQRREIWQVLYCDFLSMYPSVCTLMGLWRFVIAEGVRWHDNTCETQSFLNGISLEKFQDPGAWRNLHTIVELKLDRDVLPLRAKYDGSSPTIGLNLVSSSIPLWYTLADLIASTLLTGKAPSIMRAISFEPMDPQEGLKAIRVGGPSGALLDPLRDDFYKRLIDMRSKVKDRMDGAASDEKAALKAEQQALKILANSTSYGIFFETNVSDLDGYETREVFGPDHASFSVQTNKSEQPGPFFHPLIATLITSAARLMLAISEKLATDAGLEWAFCDTDSIAFAKPGGMISEEFFVTTKIIVDWFGRLNPYEKPGSLLKIEHYNFAGEDQ